MKIDLATIANSWIARYALPLLWIAVAFSCSILFAYPYDAPPYLDFDVATEASFVWSYLYNIPFHYPDPSLDPNNYIETFQAERFVFSFCLAPIIHILNLPSYYLGEFFRISAGLMTVVFGLVAGLTITKNSSNSWPLRLFILGFACSYPPLMLLSRNGLLYNILASVLFWLIVYLVDRYFQTSKPIFLYSCSFVATFFLFNRYLPIVLLPFIALGLLLCRGRLLSSLKDPHVYGSLLLFLLLSAATVLAIGSTAYDSPGEYIGHLQQFQNMRSRAFSIDNQLLGTPVSEKVEKLVNQQVLFKHDSLGDPKREDEVFTLGSSNLALYGLVGLFFLGLGVSVKQRHLDAVPFALVLGAIYTFAFTVSFPEGRYLLCAIPCYAFFCWRGLEWCLARKQHLTTLLAAILLLLQTGFTYKALFGPYNDYMHRTLINHEGMQEMARHLPVAEPDQERIVSMPWPRPRKLWHYYTILVGLQTPWLNMDKFDEALEQWEAAPGNKNRVFYFYAARENYKWSRKYLAKGFKVIRRFRTKIKDEPRVLLQYPPPVD